MSPRTPTVLSCLALIAFAAMSARATPEDSPESRRAQRAVSMGMYVIPLELDPAKAWNFQHFLMIHAVYQTLTRVTENGNLAGDLARRWRIEEGGRSYRFDLQPEARFHDGRPVRARDVCWSLSRHFWPNLQSVGRNTLGRALGVDRLPEGTILPHCRALDDLTVVLRLPRPYPPMLQLLALGALGVVPSGANSFPRPLGSGPMSGEYDAQRGVWRLKAYPGYTGERSTIESATVFQVSDSSTATRLLESGEADVVWVKPWMDVRPMNVDARYRLIRTDSLAFLHLFVNSNNPFFSDRSRRAELASLIQERLSRTPPTDFHEFSPHYLPRGILPPWYYRQRLSPTTPADFRAKWGHQAPVEPLRVALRAGSFTQGMIADLAEVLRQAGVPAAISEHPTQEHVALLRSGDYDITSGGYVGPFIDPDGFLDPLLSGSPTQMGRIPTDGFVAELSRIHSEDGARRLMEYARAFWRFEQEGYVIPLFQVRLPILADKAIMVPDTSFRYEAEIWRIRWDR